MTLRAKDEASEAAKQERLAMESKTMSAFQALKENKDFDTAWRYLQRKFNLHASSFAVGDEGNTHRAAIRDGEKNVMREILRLLSLPRQTDFEDGEVKLRPTSAVSELSAPTQTTP